MVVAHGHDQLSYQWYCDATCLPYGTSRELILPQVTPDQSGMYTCSITSPSGGSAISSPAQVLVSPLPQSLPPQDPQSAFPQHPMPTAMGPLHPPQQTYSPAQWSTLAGPLEFVTYEPHNGQFSPHHHLSVASPLTTGLPEPPTQPPQQRPSRFPSSHTQVQDGPVGEGKLQFFSVCSG